MKQSLMVKQYIQYVSLSILGMVGLSCYILADTFFIANGVGADGLTALNIAIPVYNVMTGCALMIGTGGGVRYTVLKSRGDSDGANRIFTTAMRLTLACSVVFFISGIVFPSTVARLLGADAAVFQMTRTYIQVILLFSPMFNFNNVMLCFVRNDGAPQLAMTAMLGGSIANIILDYIFIYILYMGLFGAVLATGIAPIVSLTLMSPYFIKNKNGFHLTRTPVSFARAGHIASIGVPSFIAELSSGIVIFVFNIIILDLKGNIGVAAYGVIANISLVILAIYTGIAQGVQPLLSEHYGFGNRRNVGSFLKYALLSVLFISVVLYGGIYVGASQIVALFNSENNPLLQSIATDGLKIYFTGCFFAGINLVMANYFLSTERPVPAQVITLLRGFFVIIPTTYAMAKVAGMTGVWWSFPVTELLVSLAGGLIYLYSHRYTRLSKRHKH